MNPTSNSQFKYPISTHKNYLDFSTVAFLSADINYTTLHFNNGQQKVYSYTIKRFEEILAQNTNFIRIHKGYLVNREYIKEVLENEVFMCCGRRLPLARRRKEVFNIGY